MKKRKAAPRAGVGFPAGLLHSLRVHSALLVSILLGLAAFLLLPQTLELSARLVMSWDIGALCYLGFALSIVMRFSLARARSRAADQDEGATLILILTVIAVAVSLGAVISLLGSANNFPGAKQPLLLTLAVGTTLISWLLIHTMFALHYAHEYYGGEDVGRGGGLKFPSDPQPDYWDFVLFLLRDRHDLPGLRCAGDQQTGSPPRGCAWRRLVLLLGHHHRFDGQYRVQSDLVNQLPEVRAGQPAIQTVR